MSSNLRIGVIGAGVVGLCSANFLQEEFPSARITVLADKFETDTLSDGAAGIFYPGKSLRSATPGQNIRWYKDSYQFYESFLKDNPREAHLAGIRRLEGYILSSENPDLPFSSESAKIVSKFRECTQDEISHFPGAKYGSYMDTMLTECRKFLPYMTNKIKSKGGVVMNWKVESFEELESEFDLVFNCSGFGAKKLCNDEMLIPIRGQIIKVDAPWQNHFTYLDYDTYIIPGMDSVTLGSVRQFNNLKKTIDRFDAAGIMDRCTKVIPSLKRAKILREWVGFRPYRFITRVEPEIINFPSGKFLKVVHNYGHGGHGVMSAPGTSKHAVEFGIQMLKSSQRDRSKL